MITSRFIAHMPGAAGNFLTRLCEQSEQGTLLTAALYPPEYWSTQRRPHPSRHNWRAMEDRWQQRPHPRRYAHGHEALRRVWLRVTVTSHEEWGWALSNALWKDSFVTAKFVAASDPGAPAQHHLPLRSTWHWPSLERALAALGLAPGAHHRTLWHSWLRTWCPEHLHGDPRWLRLMRSHDHARPTWLG